jgi:hypothetical protein
MAGLIVGAVIGMATFGLGGMIGTALVLGIKGAVVGGVLGGVYGAVSEPPAAAPAMPESMPPRSAQYNQSAAQSPQMEIEPPSRSYDTPGRSGGRGMG